MGRTSCKAITPTIASPILRDSFKLRRRFRHRAQYTEKIPSRFAALFEQIVINKSRICDLGEKATALSQSSEKASPIPRICPQSAHSQNEFFSHNRDKMILHGNFYFNIASRLKNTPVRNQKCRQLSSWLVLTVISLNLFRSVRHVRQKFASLSIPNAPWRRSIAFLLTRNASFNLKFAIRDTNLTSF